MSTALLGIGTAVPDGSMSQEEAAEMVGAFAFRGNRQRALRALFLRAGIDTRQSVLAHGRGLGWFYEPGSAPGPTTGSRMASFRACAGALAARASMQALARAEVDGKQIDHLVTVSCTGFAAPGVDRFLFDALGLNPGVTRTNIGFMGCHAAVNALRVASAYAQLGSRVLICCVELCTLHLCGTEGGTQVPSALFGDGSAAAVVGPADQNHNSILSTASTMIPDTRELMSWHMGDHGFEMDLSPRVPEVLAEVVPAWVDQWLAKYELNRSDIGSWAIHPGGPRVLGSLGHALEIDEHELAASREILKRHGNMSSGTLLFIIDQLLRSGAKMPLVGLAFGPGLGGEALLIG